MEFITRHPTEQDKSFIYSSYLKSYHKNTPTQFAPPTIYYPGQAAIADFLWANSEILLAVFPEDANEIMGYLLYQWVYDTLVIHYAYTKYAFRWKGLARDLVSQVLAAKKDQMVITTHYTDDFLTLRHKLPNNSRLVYDPYLLTSLRMDACKI